MRLTILAAALLGLAAPDSATAAAAGEDAAAQARSPFTAEQIRADLARYGAWLIRINEAQAPISAAANALRERWDAAIASGDPARAAAAFRPVVAQFAVTVERSNAALALLAGEEFPALNLPAEDRPDRIVRELQQGNLALAAAVAAYNPLLDAIIRNDGPAADRATRQLFSSLRYAMQTQLVIARASLAATPRDEPGWEVRNFLLLYSRTGMRIVAAMPEDFSNGTDASLAGDLVRLAEEVESNADAGERKVAAGIARLGEVLRQAERARNPDLVAMTRQALRLLELDREIFPLTREFARTLRADAQNFRSGRVTMDRLGALLGRLSAIRVRINAVVDRENAALSGSE